MKLFKRFFVTILSIFLVFNYSFVDINAENSSSGVMYTVHHYRQNLSDSYSLFSNENLYGDIGETVTAPIKSYPGFTCDPSVTGSVLSGTIENGNYLELYVYYKRNTHNVSFLDGDNTLKEYPNVKYGTTISSLPEIPQPTKTGYQYKSWDTVLENTIVGDTDLSIYAGFEANPYHITLDTQQGTLDKVSIDCFYDKEFTVGYPAKYGYQFNGWTITGMDNCQHYFDGEVNTSSKYTTFATTFKNLTSVYDERIIFTANWIPKPVQCTINHYKMSTNGTTCLNVASEVISVEPDTNISITDYIKTYSGFDYKGAKANNSNPENFPNEFSSSFVVPSTGSYTVNLYYSRHKNKLSLIAGDGIETMMLGDVTENADGEPGSTLAKGREISKEVYYGQTINLMAMPLNKTLNWIKNSEIVFQGNSYTYTMEDNDVSLTVSVSPSAGKLYSVSYYLQNLDKDDEYTCSSDDTLQLSGAVGTEVSAISKNIPGFTFDPDNTKNLTKGTITEDGILEMKLYYKRNTHKVSFYNGDTSLKEYSNVKYGTLLSSLSDVPSPTKTGYEFSGWNLTLNSTNMPDNDLTINAYFYPNTYNISYDLKDGVHGSEHPNTATYDTQFIVDNPTREGYTFTGWTITGMDTNEHLLGNKTSNLNEENSSAVLFKNLTAIKNATVTFAANWNANQVPYTVKHYQMNMDGQTYSLESTETRTTTANSNVTINNLKKTYTGFTFKGGKGSTAASSTPSNSFDTTVNISFDEPTVINMYYSRNKHTITLTNGTGIKSTYGEGEHYYGEHVFLTANVKKDYTFMSWKKDSDVLNNSNPYEYVMEDSDIAFNADAFSGQGTEYQIKHYKQNLDNDNYTLVETDSLFGPANSNVVASPKTYIGFTYDSTNPSSKDNGTILENGSLVLSLYYKRNKHKVSFKNGDNTLKEYPNVKYDTLLSSLSEVPTPTKTGYTFNSWDTDLSTTKLPDNDLMINALFNPNTYNISYNLNQGSYGLRHPNSATYDTQFTVDNPTRTGYAFDGWTITGMDTNEHLIGTETCNSETVTSSEVIFNNLTAENGKTVTFTANWSVEPISYTVNHYRMEIDGISYFLFSSETLSAQGDTNVALEDLKKTYTGFTFEGGKGSTIASSTPSDSFDTTVNISYGAPIVINMYYSRNKHIITLAGDEGINTLVGDGEHYFGEDVQILADVKPGYSFINWTKDSTPIYNNNVYLYTMEDDDVSFNANTTVNNNTHYTVKHMWQNIDNNEYTVKETEDLTGTTNSSVKPNVKTYIGFTSPSKQSVTISGDGTTVVEYKYDRHTYTINFDGDEPTSGTMDSQTIRFGQPLILPNNKFVKDNNTFLRWLQGDISYYIGSPFIIDETFVTNCGLKNGDSLTLKACWESNEPETTILDSDFKVGEISVVTSANTEFSMKLSTDNLQSIIGSKAAAAGSVVWLESKKSEDNGLKASTKTIIEEKTNLNCEIKECIDIKLFSQNKGEESKNIKDPASSVKITFKIENQDNIDAAKAGKLVIYSIHDGVLDPNMIVGTFNEATNEYTFDTNKFSIFALTYLPNGIPKPAGESNNTHDSNKTNGSFVPPNTGIY